jgi:3-oxoacyl-[acyl-carrier protein] reductase
LAGGLLTGAVAAPADLAEAFSLAGRVAVVTGAASGIGRQTALTFAQAGARVVVADRNENGLRGTATAVADLGGSATVVPVDVADRAAVNELAQRAVAVGSRLDVWVNAAGLLRPSAIVDTTEELMDRQLDVNLKGVYWGCAAAARVMVARGTGSIINVSSAGADLPVPELSVYSLTKAAVNMITRTLAHEVGPHGVRANCIAPGFIDTPMVTDRFRRPDGSMDENRRRELFETRARGSVLGVTGTPTDISLAMLYLACDASRFVTGQILRPKRRRPGPRGSSQVETAIRLTPKVGHRSRR